MIGWSIALVLWALGTVLFYWVLEYVTQNLPLEKRIWNSWSSLRRTLAVLSWPIIVVWQLLSELQEDGR